MSEYKLDENGKPIVLPKPTKEATFGEAKERKQSPITELSYILFINAITIEGISLGYWDAKASNNKMATAKVAFNKEDQVVVININKDTYLVPVANVRQMTVKKK